MQHFRYTAAEIDELCKIPPWTESALDKHAKQIHSQVPITRKCIVNQCLFWCDVAYRFKRNLHGRRRTQPSDSFDPQGGDFIVGVIGCGSIGSKFVRELLQRQIVEPNQIKISSRTPSRAKQRCGLEAVSSNAEVASHCTVLYIFVLPFHFRTFSREIRDTIQRTKPLVISTLAGYTQAYLQRALNSRYVITTAVDLPTVHIAANRLSHEFPFAVFATGAEMPRFQEFFAAALAKPGTAPAEEGQSEVPPEGQSEAQPEKLPEEQVEVVAEGTVEVSAAPSDAQPEQIEEMEGGEAAEATARSSDDTVRNPFRVRLTDKKQIKHLHQAAFAAENLANCGLANLNGSITSLRNWVALDSNHAKIEVRPDTYSRLWARSFVPLPCITKLESLGDKAGSDHEKPVRFMLKRAFVRSLMPEIEVDPATGKNKISRP
jgi:hypothetical protein